MFIVKLAPSGPAFLDGTLEKGDELLRIDDIPCQGLSLVAITDMLVGVRSSVVKLAVKHDGDELHTMLTALFRAREMPCGSFLFDARGQFAQDT